MRAFPLAWNKPGSYLLLLCLACAPWHPKSQRKSCLYYMRNTVKGGNHIQVVFFSSCPCQKWAIRFVFVNYPACLVQPVCVLKLRLTATAAIAQKWIKSDLFFSGGYTSFSGHAHKANKNRPETAVFCPQPDLPTVLFGLGGKQKGLPSLALQS